LGPFTASFCHLHWSPCVELKRISRPRIWEDGVAVPGVVLFVCFIRQFLVSTAVVSDVWHTTVPVQVSKRMMGDKESNNISSHRRIRFLAIALVLILSFTAHNYLQELIMSMPGTGSPLLLLTLTNSFFSVLEFEVTTFPIY
jgi:hypothetical protein